MTRDFQQCGNLTSVDSDKPVQPPVRLRNLKWCSVRSHSIFKRQAKALTRLRVCAGWSEPLLVAHTILFEISSTCSNTIYIMGFSGFIQILLACRLVYTCTMLPKTTRRILLEHLSMYSINVLKAEH